MVNVQRYIDSVLDKVNTFPVEIHPKGPLPNDSAYGSITSIVGNGFSFTTRALIQAIGLKMANLPVAESDMSLSYASIFTRILDLESPYLVYKEDVGYSSDFQTFYSEAIGVGVTCLVASTCFGIPLDQLEPIPGPGTRFDYRGRSGNLKCIFESRGTKYRNYQTSQIQEGMDKKCIYRSRGDRFDIGLVVSAFVGVKSQRPRIIIADPELSDMAFGNVSDLYYKYRHFVRVLQFIGATPLARALYVESSKLLLGEKPQNFFFNFDDLNLHALNLEMVETEENSYIGRWHESWIPKGPSRYERLKSLELPSPLLSQPKVKISVFQGLLITNFKAIVDSRIEQIVIPSVDHLLTIQKTKDDQNASVFPDGSALIVRAHG